MNETIRNHTVEREVHDYGQESAREKKILAVLVLGVAYCFQPAAFAAPPNVSYPSKPVNFIVPAPPGGSIDIEARQIAEAIKPFFPQPLVVFNRPGGGAGSVGTAEIAMAKPDGYTIGIVLSAALTVQPLLTKLPYMTTSDYTPINNAINLLFLFAVNADSPWKTMKDALDYAKANPGKITVGTPGIGSVSHFDLELLKEMAGVDMTHVPQSGDATSVTALLGGHLSASIAAPGSLLAQLQAGKLRALGTFSEKRSPMYPDLPTFKEMGYDITLGGFHSIIAPKGTPDAIVQILDAAFKKVWESEAFKKYAANTSLTLIYQGPADLKKRIDTELAISADMVKKLNLKTK